MMMMVSKIMAVVTIVMVMTTTSKMVVMMKSVVVMVPLWGDCSQCRQGTMSLSGKCPYGPFSIPLQLAMQVDAR